MKGHFSSIDEVFILLNQNKVAYLVLRNFEELDNENMFIQGHPDIDLLCEDSMSVVKVLGAFSCRKITPEQYGDGTHYYIIVRGKYVSLDLRHVGDDYYCRRWENDLLATRVAYHNFYIPCPEQLFYSLVYHAIFQKKQLSDEYKQRLQRMAGELHLADACHESDFISLLEQFMMRHAYSYVYPKDACVPLMKKWHKQDLLAFSLQSFIPHFLFHSKVALINLLVKIKHVLLK